jgi:hypothetical protein
MILRVRGVEKQVREFKEMIGSTSSWSEGRVISVGYGNYATGGVLISSLDKSLEMAINNFCSLHLCPKKYFSS